MTKNQPLLLIALFSLVATLSSCEAIGTIFKAGMWTSVIIIIIVVAIILWIVGKAKK